MHVARGYEGVGDDGVFAVHGAVIELKEPLRLAFPCHEARVGIGTADFDLASLAGVLLAGSGALPCSFRSASIATSSSAR